jgi:hypothetical protein
MKKIYSIFALIVLAAATIVVTAQDYPDEYLGLPGDNLNLYAVMNLFQESETLEKFEQGLNSEEQMINNLDLNGDKLIDYITVSDFVDGNVHNIVMRAALDRDEQQDVGVFVVEKMSNGAVQIQLIGDEALYGPNYIVEPIYAETNNPGYTGKIYNRNANVVTSSYYDIAAWPVMRFIYRPGYLGWRSSWYWGYYPSFWRPWRAHYYHYYYGYHSHWHNHYYSHYRHWDRFRCNNYNTYYRNNVHVYSHRVTANINNGRYRNTYSRPDQRSAGESYYSRTASSRAKANRAGDYSGRSNSRSGTVRNQQTSQRTGTSSTRTRSNVSTSGRSKNTAREDSYSRNNNTRSATAANRQALNRSATKSSSKRISSPQRVASVERSNRSTSVQRTQPNRSSAVQRSQPANNRSSVQRSNSKKSTPSVQRSSSRSSTVQRSQPNRSSAVQRSQPSKSRSSVQRSSSKKSTPSVQKSSSKSSRGSAVSRSQPSKSRSSVKSSSSSRSSGDKRSSSSSSRRR